MSGWPDYSKELKGFVGQANGPASLSSHAVNEAMIGHWVEAMGDFDPIYVDATAARAVGLPGVIAPPTMLMAWQMRGLRSTIALEEARKPGAPRGTTNNEQMMGLLDDEGLTSVVATNCEQTYARGLVPGDRLVTSSVIESISEIKSTGLGDGRFVTTRTDFFAVPDAEGLEGRDPEELVAAGELVGSMIFRILKYRPKAKAPAKPVGRRPRVVVTRDMAFFFEGVREGKLLIQHCTSCGTLRHPPLPSCAKCRSFEWDTVESSRRGTLFSYVVVHHPEVPGFDYPLPIGLIELEEGTRLLADIDGVDLDDIEVGMPLVVEFVAYDEDLTLPVLRPAKAR